MLSLLVTIAVATTSAIPSGAAQCRLPSGGFRSARVRTILPGDIATLRDVGSPDSSLLDAPSPLALSPDGSKVAFVVNQGDPVTNRHCRMLVVADVKADATPRILDRGGELPLHKFEVRGSVVEGGYPETVIPAWSPDGRSIGYLRRDAGITQLWQVSAAGGDPKAVTASPVDIDAWAWLSSYEVVVASKPDQLIEAAKIEDEGLRGWVYDARFWPHFGARPQLRGALPYRYQRLDVVAGTARPATNAEIEHLRSGIESDATPALLTANSRGARAWIEQDEKKLLSPFRLRYADDHGRQVRCAAVACSGKILTLAWSADQRSLVFLRREGWADNEMAFYRWRPGAKAPTPMSRTKNVLIGCLPRRDRFLCTSETSSSPRRVVEIDPQTGHALTVYDPNPEFAAFDLGTVERLLLTNNRGLQYWADLVLPPKRVGRAKLPLIIVQYDSDGFLRGGTGDEYPIFPLAAQGFAVLSIERPPSVALGRPDVETVQDFNEAEMRDWAERRSHLSATLTAIDAVIARGIADPKRIGITGLSDGATSARFALINSKIFAAAAISSSVIEPKTVMTYGGIAWADMNRALGYPPASTSAPDFWKPTSLAANANDIDTPLLIQASDDEYLLSLETFTALREHGKPVEMIVYPGEHHFKWQPAHRLATYQRAIDWFSFWLQSKRDAGPARAAQFARWQAMRAGMWHGTRLPAGQD